MRSRVGFDLTFNKLHNLLMINSETGFIEEYPEYVAEDNAMAFLSDDGGESYNRCHCECAGMYA